MFRKPTVLKFSILLALTPGLKPGGYNIEPSPMLFFNCGQLTTWQEAIGLIPFSNFSFIARKP